MATPPDLAAKQQLLNEDYTDWDTPDERERGEVYIRVLYWFAFADETGHAGYWGEWVYNWDSETPFVALFEDWLRFERPYGDLEDFRYDLVGSAEWIDVEKSPADYQIVLHATIVIEDDNGKEEDGSGMEDDDCESWDSSDDEQRDGSD
ncbi:hypothetical protein IAR55_002878 [Kwoniella newhampshirensis]|uniref:DUF4375 domain-containing protein n=1 Tax=Kwoniella newhampshirensis TaxID=1651941 RepID=A0AAW0Z013_9TREE